MQERKVLLIPQKLYCINGNNCSFICTSENCKKLAFTCMEQKCKCIQTNHGKCTLLQETKLILDGIEKQRVSIVQDNHIAFDAVIKVYEEMISQISKQKQQFIDFVDMFGLKDNMRKFVCLIRDGRQQEIDGDLAHKVYIQIEKKTYKPCDFSLDEKRVQKIWKENAIELDGLLYKMAQFRNYSNRKIDSQIIGDVEQLRTMIKFLPKSIKEFQLLYRGSQNKFSAKKFHQICDGKQDTLTIVKTQFGNIIGGYTPLQWDSPNKQQFAQDYQGESFLFSLTHKQKYELIQREKAIKLSKNYGPIFGAGWDLYLSNQCNHSDNSGVNFPHSYKSLKHSMKNQESYTSFSGQKNGNHFFVTQYEVFKVIWRLL